MTLLKLSAVLLGVVVLAACSDSVTSPPITESSSMSTGPASVGTPGALSVHDPKVLINGTPVQGTLRAVTNKPTVFQISVAAPGGLSNVRQVTMAYSQPGPNHQGEYCGGGCMGGSHGSGYSGTVHCYDDGTHGDDVAGDGTYHYMDPQNQVGCNGYNAHHGEYNYSFYCEDIHGQRSNTVSVKINRE